MTMEITNKLRELYNAANPNNFRTKDCGSPSLAVREMNKARAKLVHAIIEKLPYLLDVVDDTQGHIPRRYTEWCRDDHHDVLWWDVSLTHGEIAEPPSYIGGPDDSEWPFTADDTPHLLWVPLPKLARNRP